MAADDKKPMLKMYLKSEVARIYNVSPNKLRSMLAECYEVCPEAFPKGKKDRNHLLSIKQVKIFFEHFGEPPSG